MLLLQRQRPWRKSTVLRLLRIRLMVRTKTETARDCKKLTVIVSDPEAVQQTIANVVKDFGRIDVFIANAGT